jgi:hypothetical protein
LLCPRLILPERRVGGLLTQVKDLGTHRLRIDYGLDRVELGRQFRYLIGGIGSCHAESLREYAPISVFKPPRAALAASSSPSAATPGGSSPGRKRYPPDSWHIGSPARARTASPAITAAQARQVFGRYVAAAAGAVSPASASPVLSLVTGVERAVLTATVASHSVVTASPSAQGAHRGTLSVKPEVAVYTYGSPAFYLPEAAGYPRFFVASVTRTLRGTRPAEGATTEVGGARVPVEGPALLVFEQASAGAPWLLGSASSLAAGETLPKLATNGDGYVEAVSPTATALLAQPDDVGPLQAGVVDDGAASAAARAVAAGQLSTGLYQGAVNKTSPIRSGPPIQVPAAVQALLPSGQPVPLVQLQSQQTLSFAAVDPAPGDAKIQVIAIGGGLADASAS